MIYGYARVSTTKQTFDRQILQLTSNNVPENNIYADYGTGANFERKNYKKLLKKLKSGDTLVITSLDRLGRNFDDMHDNWNLLTRKKQVNIVILDMPIIDSLNIEKDLLGRVFQEIMITLLSYFADMERRAIIERINQGLDVARQKGVRLGRPPKKIPRGFPSSYKKWINKELTTKEIVEIYNLYSTKEFYTLKRAYERMQSRKGCT